MTTLHNTRIACSLALAALLAGGCDDDPTPDPDAGCRDLEPGHACTWAGLRDGEGYNGDGHRRETSLAQPQDLLFMPDGSAWVTDFNNFLIRRILPDGTIKSMVGATDPIFPGDGPFGGITSSGGPGGEWLLNHPTNLLLQDDGKLLVVAWHNHRLLTVDPSTGYVEVVCGAGAGFAGDGLLAAEAALFRQPSDATYDEQGNL